MRRGERLDIHSPRLITLSRLITISRTARVGHARAVHACYHLSHSSGREPTSHLKVFRRAQNQLKKRGELPILTGKSIVCFGGEDWWYHHPHSKNHLMRRFARAGNRVIFVNSISMGLPGLASKDLLPRVARKLRSYAKLARTTEEGITVVSPAALPFYGSRAARAANRRLITAQVGRLARSRGLTRPILWVAKIGRAHV